MVATTINEATTAQIAAEKEPNVREHDTEEPSAEETVETALILVEQRGADEQTTEIDQDAAALLVRVNMTVASENIDK